MAVLLTLAESLQGGTHWRWWVECQIKIEIFNVHSCCIGKGIFMGGRGASSGISQKGKPYGSEYTTVCQIGKIKFVKPNSGAATAPMETMTDGRIYVTLDYKDEPKYISFHDKENKRNRQIDLDHTHRVNGVPTQPHVHKGYFHNENGDADLSVQDKKIVDRILRIWHNKKSKS